MDLTPLLTIFNDLQIIKIFLRILAIFSSIFYLIYAVVIFKQTQIMIQTLKGENSQILVFISFLQIILGIILVFLAILLI